MFRRSLAADRGMLLSTSRRRAVGRLLDEEHAVIPARHALSSAPDGRIVSIASNAAPPLADADTLRRRGAGRARTPRRTRRLEIGAAPGDRVRNRIFKP